MKLGNVLPDWIWKAGLGGLFLLLGSVGSWSQQPTASSSSTDATAAAIRELQQQVNELRSAMAEMRAESERYRAENTELRHELQTPRGPSIASTVRPGSVRRLRTPIKWDHQGTMTLRLPNPRKRVGRLL